MHVKGMFSHVEMLLDVFLIWHIGIYYVLQKSCYWNNKYGILNKGLKKQGIRMNSFLRIPICQFLKNTNAYHEKSESWTCFRTAQVAIILRI